MLDVDYLAGLIEINDEIERIDKKLNTPKFIAIDTWEVFVRTSEVLNSYFYYGIPKGFEYEHIKNKIDAILDKKRVNANKRAQEIISIQNEVMNNVK